MDCPRAIRHGARSPGRRCPCIREEDAEDAAVRDRTRIAGLSQAELAAPMGTSQSTIARLENGQTLPSTKTLLRYAEATGSKFHVRPPVGWGGLRTRPGNNSR